jgi:hypothetical protein
MAEKERFESLTGIETDVQIEERTRHAMENYFNWLHNAILASPWSNDLNKKLLSYATEMVALYPKIFERSFQIRVLSDEVHLPNRMLYR